MLTTLPAGGVFTIVTMNQRSDITVFSSFAIDTVVGPDASVVAIRPGGPAQYIQRALLRDRIRFSLRIAGRFAVRMQLIGDGTASGRVTRRQYIPYSITRTAPVMCISTIRNEFNLNDITRLRGTIFLDVQGFVKNKRQERISLPSVFCMKGTTEELRRVPRAVLTDQKRRMLVATNGAAGCTVFIQGRRYTVKPQQRVTATDAIGAGDSLLAYLAAAYVRGRTRLQCIRYAVDRVAFDLSTNSLSSSRV